MTHIETYRVYEWQVLPFGTTYNPHCTIYAIQKHVQDHRQDNEDETVLDSFYVNIGRPYPNEAKGCQGQF